MRFARAGSWSTSAGGRSCRFAELRRQESGVRIVGVDVSDDELKHNEDVDERIVADVVQGLPFDDGSVDMIVSRSVVEHLEDSEAFVRNAKHALRGGGYFIHLLPSRFAPFALVNRTLPNTVARKVVHALVPGSEGRLGFRTFYDHCSPAEIRALLSKHGFEIVELQTNYYQADYFDFFLPLYVLMATYELAAYKLRLEQLAATILVVARKS